MLCAIKQIGKLQRDKLNKNKLEVLVKNPKFKTVLLIIINLDKESYDGIRVEDIESTKKLKYLFTEGPSNGPNPTPIANINIKEIKKTFFRKIQKWFDKYSTSTDLTKNEKLFLNSIKEIISKNKDRILNDIEKDVKDIPTKEIKGLSIKIIKDRNSQYIGEFDIFKKILLNVDKEKSSDISANDCYCSICGIKRELVSGNLSVFTFYTIDKPGFITGGFEKSLAWKNYPVCLECKFDMEEGRRYIEENMSSFNFCGIRYILIPKLIFEDSNLLKKILEILQESNKKISYLKKEERKNWKVIEEDILSILSNQPEKLTYNFLFLNISQSAERIQLLIEDIFPSRIKKILEARDAINKNTGKEFTFGDIRAFFQKSDDKKRNYDLDGYFLDIIDKVFRGVHIDFYFLNKFFMNRIRTDIKYYDSKTQEKNYFHASISRAIMSVLFFERLNLISFEEVEDMDKSIFEDVFKKYGNVFATPVKRGLFLVGALTQILLDEQLKKRGSKPFLKKLKCLRMDENDIKSLLPEIQNKFEEYKSFSKSRKCIFQEAYNYLFTAGDRWNLTNDEINFYFAGGMNLAGSIKDIFYADEKDKDFEEENKKEG